MRNQLSAMSAPNKLDAETREIDLESAIIADTRKKAVFEREAHAAAQRIRTNTLALNLLRAGRNGHSTNDASEPRSPKIKPKRRRSRKTGQRKIDFVIAVISSLTKPEFSPGEILAELHRLYPETGITRAQLSSLMWKLAQRPEGQKLFRQVARNGGNVEARYAKVEEVCRTRTRGTAPAVPHASLPESAGRNGK